MITETTVQRTTTYSYDLKNKMTSAVQPLETTDFTYTGDGMRRSRTTGTETTNYLYDGITTVRETDGAGATIADYTNNPTALVGQITSRTDASDVTSFYSYDGLGSTRNLTNQTENITAGYSYDAFGNVLDHTGDDATYTFSTKEQDPTGLYYFAARYYDSKIGRFITQDPYPANLFDPQSLNRYVYCENDPINSIDPLGLKNEKCPKSDPNSVENQLSWWARYGPPALTEKGAYALASYFCFAGGVMLVGAGASGGGAGLAATIIPAAVLFISSGYIWQTYVSPREGPFTTWGF